VNPEDAKNEEEDEWEDDEDQDQLTKQLAGLNFSDHPIVSEPGDKTVKLKKKIEEEETKVFLGTEKDLQEGEVLDFDNDAYDLFHRMTTDW
jgi:hypothetical protein